MKTSQLRSERPFEVTKNSNYKIQNYDAKNDYPQKISELVGNSGSAKSCLDTRRRFIYGLGFPTKVGETVINDEGQTLNELLYEVVEDYNKFGGIGVHCNWNRAYQITELYNTPFEQIRLCLPDEKTGRFNEVATHEDWCKYFNNIRKFQQKDIKYIKMFDPRPDAIDRQAFDAGGWPHYLGQVYYYSISGAKTYPEPIYAPVLKNMRTEEAIDTVVCRNAASGFMPSLILAEMAPDESAEQANETQARLDEFVGSENTSNIMVIQYESEQEKPEKIDLSGENYDDRFKTTQEYVPDRIGRVFQQPPILRAVDVGSNFGADAIKNAYNFYNAITESDRNVIERIFKRLLKYMRIHIDEEQLYIIPLTYSVGQTLYEKLGPEGMRQVTELIARPETEISNKRKRALLEIGFGLTEKEINDLMSGNYDSEYIGTTEFA